MPQYPRRRWACLAAQKCRQQKGIREAEETREIQETTSVQRKFWTISIKKGGRRYPGSPKSKVSDGEEGDRKHLGEGGKGKGKKKSKKTE